MKAPINDPEQEALDLLFFEYLEDELPSAEAKAFEQRLAQDPALQQELDGWKDTYVSQGFYNTTALEARLQASLADKLVTAGQPAGSFSFFTFLNGVVPFVLSSLLSFIMATDQSPEPIKVFPERAGTEVTTSTASDIPAEPVAPFSHEEEGNTTTVPEGDDRNPQHEAGMQLSVTIQEEKEQQEKDLKMHLPQIAGLSMEMLHSNMGETAPVVTVKKVRIPKKSKENNISRSQQRKIQKRKEKALQERAAREFMKGKVPYVVPLNSQNF